MSAKLNLNELQKQIESLKQQIAQNNAEASNSGNPPPMAYRPTPKVDNSKLNAASELYQNQFDLPQSLRDEITAKGYNYKFINFSKFKANAVHRSQWVPYRPDIDTLQDMVFGKSPDGFITRGDTVLAVRPLAVDAAFKKQIQEKNRRLSGHNDAVKAELQKMVKENLGPSSVAYGDEDGE